jgi:hypothetical protein
MTQKEKQDPILARLEAIYKEFEDKLFVKDSRSYFDEFYAEVANHPGSYSLLDLIGNKEINAKKIDQRILRCLLFYAFQKELKRPDLQAAINLFILEQELTDPKVANTYFAISFLHDGFLLLKEKRANRMTEVIERFFQYSPMLGPEYNEYIKTSFKVFLNRTESKFDPKSIEKAKTTSKFYGRLYEYYIRNDHEFDILLIPFEEKILFAEFFEAYETGMIPSGEKFFQRLKVAKEEMNSYADPGKTLFGPKRGDIDYHNIYYRIGFTKAIDIIMPTFFKLRKQNLARIFAMKIAQGISPHVLVAIRSEDRKPETLAIIEEDLYYFLGKVDDTLFKTLFRTYSSSPEDEDPHYFIKHISSMMANKSIDFAKAALKLVQGYEPLFKGKFDTMLKLLTEKVHGKDTKKSG